MKYITHPTSEIESDDIGEGTRIWHYSHILHKTKIGKDCVIGQNVMIGPEVNVGDNCKIQNNVSIYKGVTLENKVFCGPSMVFTNVLNPRAFVERKDDFKKTLVREGATIGANATVICGTTIGRYSMIGAGSVVTKNVPDFSLILGVPGKISGWVCKCGEVITREVFYGAERYFECPRCCLEYKQHFETFEPK
jgi:UDP-2-acetamido-3-amino-2,3-dideoxy-glucuronate N-acetyltransferase